jgi:hypothetical protein
MMVVVMLLDANHFGVAHVLLPEEVGKHDR